MLISEHPKNQTKEHYELMQIAKVLVKHRGCGIISEEVSTFKDKKEPTNRTKKGIVDVAGAKISFKNTKKMPSIDFYCFEAKASLADFRNGFNSGGDYNYIIAPKGIIPPKEIPRGIGFYEVDLENYKLSFTRIIRGIKLVKRPQRKKLGIHYLTRIKKMVYIAQRATNTDLYKYCKIKVEGFNA